jgi:drug/metabolite transporter (DMT)-like permease
VILVAVLGLLAAASSAAGQVLTKDFVDRLPPRQLIGVLYALNAALVLPAAPFVTWHVSGRILLLHALSVLTMAVSVLFIFELFVYGTASATTVPIALSPLPAAAASALLGLGTLSPLQALACGAVVGAVLIALPGAFVGMGRGRALAAVAMAALGNALVTVLSRLLADEGAGTIEIYLVRTAACAAIFLVAAPPRGVPARTAPLLTLRAVFITAQFVLIIEAVRRGSPAVVQTLVATAPLLALALESARRPRLRPSGRVLGSALVVLAGVAAVAAG